MDSSVVISSARYWLVYPTAAEFVGTHGGATQPLEDIRCVPLDVTNADKVRSALANERPTHLFHHSIWLESRR